MFVCDHCDYKYRSQLSRHQQAVHTEKNVITRLHGNMT